MNFLKKAAVCCVLFFACAWGQRCTSGIGHVDVQILKHFFSIDICALCAFVVVFVFAFLIFLKLACVCSVVCKKLFPVVSEEDLDAASINALAHLFILADCDEAKIDSAKIDLAEVDKKIVVKHRILETILLLQRQLPLNRQSDLTNDPLIDAYITKHQIRELIKNCDIAGAVEKSLFAAKKYCKFLNVLQDELLSVAIAAKSGDLQFLFDPTKYKYNLSSEFIEKYSVQLILLDFEKTDGYDAKLKILEKGQQEHKYSSEISYRLLEFVGIEYSKKKAIELIKNIFASKPDRNLANFFVKFDLGFEKVWEIVCGIHENNIERLWFLLIVSLNQGLMEFAKDMLIRITKLDFSNDIFAYYIKYHEKFAHDVEILSILKGKVR